MQTFAGEWIDVPPLPDTFVVNIGKGEYMAHRHRLANAHWLRLGLEALTSGVALATCHRVVSPPAGSGTRYSVPFFQMIAQRYPHVTRGVGNMV